MTARRRHTVPATIAALALATPVLAGCGAIDTAMDCARTAAVITDSVNDLQQAVQDAAQDPTGAQQALDRIDKNLGKLDDTSDNADIADAVSDLDRGVQNIRDAIKDDKVPDLGPVQDAASDLTSVCSPG